MKLFGAILLVACALTCANGRYIITQEEPETQQYVPEQQQFSTSASDFNSQEQYKHYVYKSIADMIRYKLQQNVQIIEEKPVYKETVKVAPQQAFEEVEEVETLPAEQQAKKVHYGASTGEVIELQGPGSLIKMKSERPVVLKLKKSQVVTLSNSQKAQIMGEFTSNLNQQREYVPMRPNIAPLPEQYGQPSILDLPPHAFTPIQYLHPYQSTFSGARLNRFKDRYLPTLGLANFRNG